MPTGAIHQPEPASSPILSSQAQGWENIRVEQFQLPPGEVHCDCSDEHLIHLSLAPRPIHLVQVQAGKTYRGLYQKGDLSIVPVQVPIFARWEEDDSYLQIRLAAEFIQNLARESLAVKADSLELRSEYRTRDPQIEAIAMLLLAELNQPATGSKLYVESLTNLLAVHLLRQYTATNLQLPSYEGGLPERQLLQVLDYINDHLEQEIRLANLAQLLDMSQFHFSHLFKQSIGVAPYQYLLQQRVERAKQLLKQTDQSIMNIALLCGFNSHSHLSKQFRQLTGMTPKNYRSNVS